MKLEINKKFIELALRAGKTVLLVARDHRMAFEHKREMSRVFSDVDMGRLLVIEPQNVAVLGRRFDLIVYEYPKHSGMTDMLSIAEWIWNCVKPTLNPGGEEVELL